MERSRTEYSAINTSVAVVARITAILMGFVTRVVFTRMLNENYVGVNGLFTDILNVLSLTELGVGTAITYALYRPIAEKDTVRQQQLMKLFRTFYRVTALVVAGLGLCLLPFLDTLMKSRPEVEHLTLIYLMYLADSVLSYLLVYKRTLIEAHQKNYVVLLYQTGFLVVQDVLQIAALVLTENFILFLAIRIFCTVLTNILISLQADRMYPYLREHCQERLPAGERSGIFQNIRAMMMHKLGLVAVNNTDNLLISAFVGVASVGIYSNYYLLIGSVRQVLDQVFQGITASVGNLGVRGGRAHMKRVYETAFFIGQWLYGFAAICLYELLDPFVELAFGAGYVFERRVVLMLCINFFVTGTRRATLTFRDSMGLFWYDRYKSVAEAVLNLVLSVLLVFRFEVFGIFLGTFLSALLTSVWIEPFVLYRKGFQTGVLAFFGKYIRYAVTVAAGWLVTDYLCGFVEGTLLWLLVGRLGICLVVPNVMWLLFHCRTQEWHAVAERAGRLIRKRLCLTGKTAAVEEETDRGEELCRLLDAALHDRVPGKLPEGEELSELLRTADRHSVLPLLYDAVCVGASDGLSETEERLRETVRRTGSRVVRQSYHLLFLTRFVVRALAADNISCIVLKGCSAAAYYPVPELRKSGDIDLLLESPQKVEAARRCLEKQGFLPAKEQHANHHLVCVSPDGICVELHMSLTEPFDDQRINGRIAVLQRELFEHVREEEIMGILLPVPEKPYFAFCLLLHMLQHFLRSGFGLKLLCDWVVFWEQGCSPKEEQIFLRLLEETGTEGFSATVTGTCVRYLGLCEETTAFMTERRGAVKAAELKEFLREVLEAEEFGKSEKDRMVALRGSRLSDYLREFHHQTLLTYEGAARYPFLLPVYWVRMLAGFIRRNRRLRGVSSAAVFRKAAKRGRLVEKMKLFQVENER